MANVFLDEDEVFPIGARASVFGRQGGNEGVTIQPGVQDVTLDANMERIDLAQSAGDASLQATGNGLEIRDSDGNTVVSVASFNQDADVRFNDGNVTVRQSGATEFTLEGSDGSTQTVDTQSSAGVSVPLGNETSNSGDDGQRGSDESGGGGSGGDTGSDANSISGEVLVDGSAATSIPSSAGTLTVGASGSGSADLVDGQDRTFTSNNFDNVEIAAQSGSQGSLTLDGEGTDVVTAGTDNTVQVGRMGDGALTVENGATIRTLQLDVARNGTGVATITGEGSGVIASNDDGMFAAPFESSGSLIRAGRNDGSDGRIEVLDGAALTLRVTPGSDVHSTGVIIGDNIGSVGELLLDDGNIDISQTTAANGKGPFFVIGNDGGTGTATLRSGSNVTVNGESAFVGVSDAPDEGGASSPLPQSTLSIESGSTLNVSGTDPGTNVFDGLSVGEKANSNGRLDISGTGSELVVTSPANNFLNVGDKGEGILTVTDGAEVNMTGQSAFFQIGFEGQANGTLNIDNATVTNDAFGMAFVARGAQTSGTVTIGDGGTFAAGRELLIGSAYNFDTNEPRLEAGGTATVTVEQGGTLNAGEAGGDGTADIFVGNDANLTVEAGATMVGDIEIAGGATFNLSPGATHDGDVL